MSRLGSLVQHNLLAKLAALIVAVVLWLYVMNDQNPSMEASYTVPVTMESVPDGYLMHAGTDTVTIRVRGPRSYFVSADNSDFHARVDLSNFTEGERAYAVKTSIPYGFELVSVSPDRINITLDRIIQRTFRINLSASGKPADGFTVEGLKQSNDKVTVEGPRSLVDQVTEIAAYVSLSDRTGDFTMTVSLVPLNADGREVQGVTLSPASTEVTGKIARGLSRKTVDVQVKPRSDLPPQLKLEGIAVQPARIEISGTKDVLDKVTSIETEDFSLSDVKESGTRQVHLRLPNGVTAANQTVTAEIKVGTIQ